MDESDILVRCGNRYAVIFFAYTPLGSILDVGAPAGFVLKGFEEKGWKVQGVEPNETMANYARTEL